MPTRRQLAHLLKGKPKRRKVRMYSPKALTWVVEMLRTHGWFLPLQTKSESNMREHWAAKATRTKKHRQISFVIAKMKVMAGTKLPARITLTRFTAHHTMLDDDNLRCSLKAVRDGIADAFGVDDGSPLYEWKYDQKKAPGYGVGIVIVERK